MSTYTQLDFDCIAAAIGCSTAVVLPHAKKFEAAAMWHRLAERRPRRMPPSKLYEKIEKVYFSACDLEKNLKCENVERMRIFRQASRLLKSLAVHHPDEAPDGPGDHEVKEALVFEGEVNEDHLIGCTRRLGRLAEIFGDAETTFGFDLQVQVSKASEVAREFKRRSIEALQHLKENGARYENDGEIVKVDEIHKGHRGDVACNDWIADMMDLYEAISGKPARTSVNKPGQADEGIASGPLIRFLKAAGKPMGFELSEDALRRRVRTMQKAPRHRV